MAMVIDSAMMVRNAVDRRTNAAIVLSEGAYLIETVFPRLASTATCEKAFGALFQDVIVDESMGKEESTHARFVGRVPAGQRLHLESTECIEWSYVKRLPFDPYDDIRREEYPPHKLIPGQLSAIRFLSRLGRRDMRGPAIARDVVEGLLVKMGFQVHKLARLRQNLRLPDRPGAGQALWLGVVTWTKTPTPAILTINDPFCVEDLAPVEGD